MNTPNTPNDPATPTPSITPPSAVPGPPPPLPAGLPADAGIAQVLEALLKHPLQLVMELQRKGSARTAVALALTAFIALAVYGVIIGTFSGGSQLFLAPLKVSLGSVVSVLICLPSLFIFACLAGAEISLRGLVGALCAMMALTALLLVGFAPVAWVFSQSTDSIAVMGTLHLFFWLIALAFGLRLLTTLMSVWRVSDRLHLRVWKFIFVLVCLQMTTALRPIIGTSADVLPREKKFFVAHWVENLFRGARTSSVAD